MVETENALRALHRPDSNEATQAEATAPEHAANAGPQPVAEAHLPQNALEAEEDAEQLPDITSPGTQDAHIWAPAHGRQAAADAEPDFAKLAGSYPELRPYVRVGRNGRGSIDFTDFEAARCGRRVTVYLPRRMHCPPQGTCSSQMHMALQIAAVTCLTIVRGEAYLESCWQCLEAANTKAK